MKTKYPRMFGLLAAVLLVASFVIPASLMNPAPVEAGVCKWDTINLPGSLPLKNDIRGGSEILDMAVGGDGATILFVGRTAISAWEATLLNLPTAIFVVQTNLNLIYYSNNGGISFTGSKFLNLLRDWPGGMAAWEGELIYQVAIAPDNPKFWAVTTDLPTFETTGPREVWVTTDAGNSWDRTTLNLTSGETVRSIDISVDYGGKRDIAVGTTTGGGAGRLWVVKSTGFASWWNQHTAPSVAPLAGIDYFAVKFSPTYAGDASIAVVYATDNATYYNIGLRDIDANTTPSWAFGGTDIAVKDPTWTAAMSPSYSTLNKADLELPSDFSGQAASLRRAYISLDAHGSKTTALDKDGIFRIDDTTVYTLMDTSNITEKSIYSIAYFGTYASGKLLAGERRGYMCTATVPTWFTDSPTTCPIPCWYPALKPTTGAAGSDTCAPVYSDGGALVGWRADGNIAYAGTSSNIALTVATWYSEWGTAGPTKFDESAFAISRNNGETWNQIAYIDTATTMRGYAVMGGKTYSSDRDVYLTDVAVTPDCKTAYLAWNSYVDGDGCDEFDMVWRSSSNIDVVSPFPALPIGIFWERVLTRVTSDNCTNPQTDKSLLRLVPYCADPSGQIVAWGVYDTNEDFSHGIAAWSPDYGDYWANITPRNPIQDFTFESKTVMYFLSPGALVQKMPYTGTAWSTTLADVDSVLMGGHTIAAYPDGKVLVGADASSQTALYAASYSSNFNTDTPSFGVLSLAGKTDAMGNVHTAFDPNFKANNTIFIADDNETTAGAGSVYRNNPAAQISWPDVNMMAAANGAVGCNAPHDVGQYGLVLAFTGQALYSAHTRTSDNATVCGVDRTIDDGTGKYGPLSGMPKPGIAWDCLDTFVNLPQDTGTAYKPCFTLEPSSLKACGCCTLDTDTTLYAIDNKIYYPATPIAYDHIWAAGVSELHLYPNYQRMGMVWAFTDCVAKKGPMLITADKTLIGCDPVSGRAQEVNLCWEQLCVANAYDIEIAKSAEFTIKVIDWVTEGTAAGACGTFLEPADVTKPCAFFPAGGTSTITIGGPGSAIAQWGNLECGHTYYWRVKVRECATGQDIRSPWSGVRSFTVKAGLPVTTPYYGVQLLAPNNGGMGIPVKPVSFSWSPFKDTTKYKFVLAKDAAMTQVVKEADVATTAFEYDGALDYSANYFWRVMSVEPAPSDWSATFSFLTEAAPAAEKAPAPAPPTPVWVWVVIALGAILVIVTLVLIFKTRRV